MEQRRKKKKSTLGSFISVIFGFGILFGLAYLLYYLALHHVVIFLLISVFLFAVFFEHISEEHDNGTSQDRDINISKKRHDDNNAVTIKNNQAAITLTSDKVEALRTAATNQVVGQDEAINIIATELRCSLKEQELTKKPRPILGTFMLVGPTGVGKTETTRAIGDFLKDYGHQYLFFQMSNFTDYHTASSLVGSPKGYIGSNEGGALTRPLMKNPKSVMVFDEMEKAHGSLFRIFMGLLDSGEMQEVPSGVIVKVSNAIVFFTSNLMQGTIREVAAKVQDEVERMNILRDVLQGNLQEAARIVSRDIIENDLRFISHDGRQGTPFFPPEFLGRINMIVPYKPITDEHLWSITLKIAAELNIKNQEALKKVFIKNKPIADKYGVRPYIKAIKKDLLGV